MESEIMKSDEKSDLLTKSGGMEHFASMRRDDFGRLQKITTIIDLSHIDLPTIEIVFPSFTTGAS